jgi:hypothetical protein
MQFEAMGAWVGEPAFSFELSTTYCIDHSISTAGLAANSCCTVLRSSMKSEVVLVS